MLKIRTFGEQLAAMLSKRSMSASALAAALKLKQSISISRLLKDLSSERKQLELIDLLRQNGELFDDDELEALREGVEVTRLGKRAYKTQKSIETLIFGGDEKAAEPVMEDGSALSSFLAKFPDNEPLQIICINCIESGVPGALETLLSDPRRLVSINHYVCINEDTRNPALVLRAASGMLLDKRYNLYLTSTLENGTDAYFFAPCAIFIKLGVSQYGEEHMLIVTSDGRVKSIKSLGNAGIFDTVSEWVGDLRPKPRLLKGAYEQMGVQGLLEMSFLQYKMENRRAIYYIKPDICGGHLPLDVIESAFAGSEDIPEDAKQSIAAQLRPLFDKRYHIIREKKQPSYSISSPSCFRRFLETGRLSDHVFCMRPFTVDERIRILDELIDMAQSNPHYHFHFLNDGLQVHRFQFVCCEGLGVLALRLDTDYRNDEGKDNLYITEDMFTQQYINYYMQTLIPRHCRAEDESLAMLKAMREKLAAQ